MDPAGSSAAGQRRSPALLWWIPVLVVVAGTAVALPLVPDTARTAVAWCGGIGAAVVAVVGGGAAARARAADRQLAQYVARETGWRRQLAQQEGEMVRLASLLPEAVARLQKGEFAEDVFASVKYDGTLSAEFRAAHSAALRSVVEAIQNAEDLRESAERGFVNIARRVQAIIHQQAQSLREMEDRHGQEPKFFADLLKIDHGTALVGRLADSIAVLGGDRPGRQWGKAVPLFSVLRGAMSRILDYQRVELHPVAEVAVTGPAVEPLIHALAELLDNATRYSPPHARVHLTAVEVQSGIAVEIEDGGVGLSEEAYDRAERMLQRAQAGIDLHDLGETPRLGLAVVGRLARAWGFTVSLRSSAYGGVRAVLIVPQVLITTTPATSAAHGIGASGGPRPLEPAGSRQGGPRPSRPGPAADRRAGPTGPVLPTRRSAGPASVPRSVPRDPEPGAEDDGVNGLPQRRRHHPVDPPVAEPAARPPSAAGPGEQRKAPEPGVWLGDFTRGLAGEPLEGAGEPAARDAGPGPAAIPDGEEPADPAPDDDATDSPPAAKAAHTAPPKTADDVPAQTPDEGE